MRAIGSIVPKYDRNRVLRHGRVMYVHRLKDYTHLYNHVLCSSEALIGLSYTLGGLGKSCECYKSARRPKMSVYTWNFSTWEVEVRNNEFEVMSSLHTDFKSSLQCTQRHWKESGRGRQLSNSINSINLIKSLLIQVLLQTASAKIIIDKNISKTIKLI